MELDVDKLLDAPLQTKSNSTSLKSYPSENSKEIASESSYASSDTENGKEVSKHSSRKLRSERSPSRTRLERKPRSRSSSRRTGRESRSRRRSSSRRRRSSSRNRQSSSRRYRSSSRNHQSSSRRYRSSSRERSRHVSRKDYRGEREYRSSREYQSYTTRRHSRSRSPRYSRYSSSHRSNHIDPREESKLNHEIEKDKKIPGTQSRDKRTVFVTQLSHNLRTRDLFDFFDSAGKVYDVKMVSDRQNRKRQGSAYVEFYEEAAVPIALEMSGSLLCDVPILVQESEAEKNKLAEESYRLMMEEKKQKRISKLYVGNIHHRLTESDLSSLFGTIGQVKSVNLMKDDYGESKGFAYVKYESVAEYRKAVEQLDGFELAGKKIKVGTMTERISEQPLDDSSKVENPKQPKNYQEKRFESPCILLKHMYNPMEETALHWEYEIGDDVRSECLQFGKVEHLSVKKNIDGEIYLKMDNILSGKKVYENLNGRYFNKRRISVEFIPIGTYRQLYPNAF